VRACLMRRASSPPRVQQGLDWVADALAARVADSPLWDRARWEVVDVTVYPAPDCV